MRAVLFAALTLLLLPAGCRSINRLEDRIGRIDERTERLEAQVDRIGADLRAAHRDLGGDTDQMVTGIGQLVANTGAMRADTGAIDRRLAALFLGAGAVLLLLLGISVYYNLRLLRWRRAAAGATEKDPLL